MRTLIAAILLSIATSASAGGQKGAPKIFGDLKAKVGAWAEYEFETTKKGKTSEKGTYRSAVVAKDAEGTWIEQRFELTEPKPKKDEDRGGVMKMLIGKDGKAKRMLMKTSRGVMDMTRMMGMGKESEPVEFEAAGKETVSTPAGSFKADKKTGEGVTLWIKEGIGPYGMVKQVSTEGKEATTMLLKGYGKDAKAEVEVPAEDESSGAGMMPPGMPDIGAMMRQASEKRGKKKRKGDDEEDDDE